MEFAVEKKWQREISFTLTLFLDIYNISVFAQLFNFNLIDSKIYMKWNVEVVGLFL